MGFAAAQPVFGLLSFIDVNSQAIPLDDVSLSIAEGLATGLMPTILTFRPTQTVHGPVGSSALNRVSECVCRFCNVIWMQEVYPTTMLQIVKSQAKIVFQSPLIDIGEFAIGRARPEEGRHRFDDLTELVFALPKRLLQPSLIVDVDQDAVPTKHGAITGPQWFSAYIEPAISAVCSAKSADYVMRIFSFEAFEPVRHLKCGVVGVDSFRPSPAGDFAKRRAKIIEHTLVDVFNIAVGRGPPHQRRNGVRQQPKR